MPGSALLTKELTSPNDIFIYGDYIYISDTTGGENQTGKILIYNTENGEINYIGEDFLKNPVISGSYGEEWSLRKLLRRFVWHDRIHARQYPPPKPLHCRKRSRKVKPSLFWDCSCR